ncbi:MAG: XRE family transcriptional regulator [Deltaproteobacteria bacterium]|nr:XRE family transcriptional regulator [Deltaproteobacteria bacterium]
MTLGAKVRELRSQNGLTLQQVAEGAGCSAAYISQIEHDKVSPSIASLKKIASVLGVRIVDFFLEDTLDEQVVFTPDQWPVVSMPGWSAHIRQMVRGTGQRTMQPFRTEIEPGGGCHEPYSHQGEEFGLVLKGELTLVVGSETYQVPEGASFYHSSQISHSWVNQGDEPCQVIWVVTPPSW